MCRSTIGHLEIMYFYATNKRITIYSSIEVANYFLVKAREEHEPLSNLKLQKMVHLAHGLYLVGTGGEPLLKDRIEVWPYGPVISSLYHKFKIYGADTIPISAIPEETTTFNEKTKKVLDQTWEMCTKMDAIKLTNWTHLPESPWQKAVDEGKSIIPDEEIKKYFNQFSATD
jgi:uncharacterized phage-associated protein